MPGPKKDSLAQPESGGASETEGSDKGIPVQIVTTDDGNIVVRDSQGRIAYPNYIPPEVESPTGGRRPHSGRASPPGIAELRKAASDPTTLEIPPKPLADSRPTYDKKFVTELPKSGERTTAPPPAITRARTNLSQLQQALSYSRHVDDSSSSSSSSSDEDEAPRRDSNKSQRSRSKSDDMFRKFKVGNDKYKTKGKVSKRDGRLAISVKDTSNTGYLAKALGTAFQRVVPLKEDSETDEGGEQRPSSRMSTATKDQKPIKCPRLNIVIMVIGSRGDAQPFLKIGKVLKEQYGHRVRIATHPAFREFVEKDSGLEFFSVGGDPSELMAFMVKNPGMIPTLETVKAGDIGRRRAAMAEMFEGFWRACVNATDDEEDTQNIRLMGNKEPFVADAIIANPPSFAHVHCAEALGIPLHLMFTFPYTPTQAFPHPLASIKRSNVDPGYTNFISYPLVEMMVWQGLGDLVNDFRVKALGLDPVSTLWAPGATYRLHVPFTYLWSPGLVPKPEDWGNEIDVSGFVFLDLASSFKPPSDLEKFLADGDAPIYIGFGSIVVDDAERFTEMIFEAVKLAGVRALVSEGWGGLGGENVPDNVFMLDNTPHDWLFPKIKACVIHGGAGTTAIALKCGIPTMIVPFFGDQHFWGSMLYRAGAGPEPVPYKELTAEKLAEGIKFCLTEEAREGVGAIAKDIELEGDGAENACKYFHRHLTLKGKHSMRCSILEDRVAVWQLKDTNMRLSAVAADALVDKGYVQWKKLRLIRHNEWNDFEGPGEPVTGFAGSVVTTVGDVVKGVGGVPYRVAKASSERRERKEKRRKAHDERKAKRIEAKNAAKRAKGKTTTNGVGENSDQNAKKETGSQSGKPLKQKSLDTKDFANKDNRPPPTDGAQQQPDHVPEIEGDDGSLHSTITDATEENPAEEFVNHVGKGVGKSAHAIALAPVDLSLAVAQGFHNAPRLYGDDTVRRPPRVTGMRSGLKAAKYEFVYGIYDGWTGVVRLPVRGAKRDGFKGFVKGTGMGVTGLFLKNISALVGPVGYTLKGIAKQAERGKQPVKIIRKARIIQGQRDMRSFSEEERAAKVKQVLKGWEVLNALWEATLQQQAHQGGLRQKLSSRKKRGLGAAFENVEIAEEALAAVQRGEGLETVVGKQHKKDDMVAGPRSRKSEDGGQRKSTDKRKSFDKGRDSTDSKGKGKGKAKTGVDEPIEEHELFQGQGHAEFDKKPLGGHAGKVMTKAINGAA